MWFVLFCAAVILPRVICFDHLPGTTQPIHRTRRTTGRLRGRKKVKETAKRCRKWGTHAASMRGELTEFDTSFTVMWFGLFFC